MTCRYCERDPKSVVLLPWHGDDVSLSPFACLDCALNLRILCTRHELAHLGFEGDGHACIKCINEKVEEYQNEGRNPLPFLVTFASPSEMAELINWAELSSAVTGNPIWVSVLRCVVAVAEQYKTDVELFLVELYNQGTLKRLLHPSFTIPTALPPV